MANFTTLENIPMCLSVTAFHINSFFVCVCMIFGPVTPLVSLFCQIVLFCDKRNFMFVSHAAP